MNIIFGVIYVLITAYYIINFAKVIEKMNEKPILPLNEEELSMIRKHPEKKLQLPTFKEQKVGIIFYTLILFMLFGVFIFGLMYKFDQWSMFFILLLPLSYSTEFLNMFVIVEGGILSGNKYTTWKKMKSFEFKRIDVNHKYYGYTTEINNKGYELIIKQGIFPISCIVLTEEMKEKLTEILKEHIDYQNKKD